VTGQAQTNYPLPRIAAEGSAGVARVCFLKRRFPARAEAVSIFGVVVFAVHSWSVYGFLFNLPAFVLRYRAGEIVAVFFYHMAFAFLESVFFSALLVLVAALLPFAWIRKGFVYRGFLLLLAATVGAIALQNSFSFEIFEFDASNLGLLYERIGGGLILFAGTWALTQKYAGVQRFLGDLADRISIMLFVYLPLDAVGLLVVAWRLLR
jgi:hypothetical protein